VAPNRQAEAGVEHSASALTWTFIAAGSSRLKVALDEVHDGALALGADPDYRHSERSPARVPVRRTACTVLDDECQVPSGNDTDDPRTRILWLAGRVDTLTHRGLPWPDHRAIVAFRYVIGPAASASAARITSRHDAHATVEKNSGDPPEARIGCAPFKPSMLSLPGTDMRPGCDAPPSGGQPRYSLHSRHLAETGRLCRQRSDPPLALFLLGSPMQCDAPMKAKVDGLDLPQAAAKRPAPAEQHHRQWRLESRERRAKGAT